MPRISVIIPTYNRPNLVKKAVESVLNQTFIDLEVIVIDDGLDQRAENLIQSITDSRLKYIKHEINKGGGAARNTGIKIAKGKFIAFLDDDDIWLSDKLEKQMSVFEKTFDDVGFCFCRVINVYDSYEEPTHEIPEGIKDYHQIALKAFSLFLTVTLVVKKEVFDDIGFFDEALPSHQETDFVLRMTKKYKGIGVNRPLVRVSMTEPLKKSSNFYDRKTKGKKMIIEKYFEEYKKNPDILAYHYFRLAILYRENNEYNNAKKAFLDAYTTHSKIRYLMHYFSMSINGLLYKLLHGFYTRKNP